MNATIRAFLVGAGAVLDLGGTLGAPELPAHTDAEALAEDWRAVGDALRAAMAQLEREVHADDLAHRRA